LFPRILGGPFFTSVPAGRVGVSKDFVTNEMFVSALRGAEHKDSDEIGRLMGAGASRGPLKRVGVNQLRSFLESRVEDCYRRNVAKIVPLLQHELRLSEAKLAQVEEELNSLSIDRLRNAANIYREKFSKELSETIHGTVRASPDEWGETLEAEQLRGGSFMEQDQVRSAMWQRVLEVEVGHNKHKLFGGAQYHRALREFTVAVRHMRSPQVSEDEIANAAGLGEVHDGVNFMRAACVIAIEKAQTVFEPMLEALRHRSVHIMRRLFPIVEHMAAKNGGGLPADVYNRPLQDMIRRVYDKFVDQQMEVCLGKCRDDLKGMTRFVTWDSDGRGGSSVLYKHLPTPKRMSQIYTAVVEQKQRPAELKASSEQYDRNSNRRGNDNKDSKGKNEKQSKGWGKLGSSNSKSNNNKGDNTADRIFSDWNQANGDSDSSDVAVADSASAESTAVTSSTNGLWEEEAQLSDYYNLLQLMEEMLAGRNANRTNTVVTAIVQHIIKTWTEHFARTVSMKFNCFFLMPFLDNFPSYLVSNHFYRVFKFKLYLYLLMYYCILFYFFIYI